MAHAQYIRYRMMYENLPLFPNRDVWDRPLFSRLYHKLRRICLKIRKQTYDVSEAIGRVRINTSGVALCPNVFCLSYKCHVHV